MSLRDQLQSIHDDHGKLTPSLVVEVARPADHPLHSRFEWDDSVAGEAWRRQQAHELIRSVKVVYREATDTEPERSVRAFHAVRRADEITYESADSIVRDPLTLQILLRDMERDWKQLKRRYAEFSEFLTMVRNDVEEHAA